MVDKTNTGKKIFSLYSIINMAEQKERKKKKIEFRSFGTRTVFCFLPRKHPALFSASITWVSTPTATSAIPFPQKCFLPLCLPFPYAVPLFCEQNEHVQKEKSLSPNLTFLPSVDKSPEEIPGCLYSEHQFFFPVV